MLLDAIIPVCEQAAHATHGQWLLRLEKSYFYKKKNPFYLFKKKNHSILNIS